MNRHHSSLTDAEAEFPQGLIFEALLFLISIKIVSVSLASNPNLFTDDNLVFSVVKKSRDTQELNTD